MALQDAFVQSEGAPVELNGLSVVQADRISIRRGWVQIEFLSAPEVLDALSCQGLGLEAKGGSIRLSDGTAVPLLHVWHKPDLPPRVLHWVDCPTNELLVWNIYQIRHYSGFITDDCFTGNAGMVVTQKGAAQPALCLQSCAGAV
jgi:hypothetical protein